jgi:hypothetical protein
MGPLFQEKLTLQGFTIYVHRKRIVSALHIMNDLGQLL